MNREYSWPSRVPARTCASISSFPSDILVTSLNFQEVTRKALYVTGFVTYAESSCHRYLDLVLPRRTSKEQGHKELTRIKDSSVNRESQVGAPLQGRTLQYKSGKPGGLCSGPAFQFVP